MYVLLLQHISQKQKHLVPLRFCRICRHAGAWNTGGHDTCPTHVAKLAEFNNQRRHRGIPEFVP